MRRLVLFVVASCILTGCIGARHKPAPIPTPRPAPDSTTTGPTKTRPYEVFGQHYYPVTDATGYRERGVASWYGGKFHGRKTANGERYDMHKFTAAHTTLPLPTWVKVTNLRNGATVTVRINDRGPFVKNRLIDLSYAAALQLGMVADGTTLVEVEAIASAAANSPPMTLTALRAPAEPETMRSTTAQHVAVAQIGPITDDGAGTTPAPDTTVNTDRGENAPVIDSSAASRPVAPAAAAPLIYVQVGAFGERGNAERLQTTLYNAGIADVRLNSGDREGTPVHRVQIGPIAGVLDYDVLIAQLESIGISDTHLVTQ